MISSSGRSDFTSVGPLIYSRAMTVGAILKNSMSRLRRQNPSFSLTALAEKMNVSAAFLSQVFNDRKPLPSERLGDMVRHLKIDRLTEKNLKRAMVRARVKEAYLPADDAAPERAVQGYAEAADKDYELLRYWYLPAILNLTTCAGFDDDPAWLAKRLAITEGEARRALLFLKKNEYLVKDEGVWKTTSRRLRFPARSSHPLVRGLNREVLKKAFRLLEVEPSREQYEERLMTTLSVAVNRDRIPEAVTRLQAAMFDIANFLADGDCTEVYHLSAQLFPSTRSSERA